MTCLSAALPKLAIPGLFVTPPLIPGVPLPVTADFCCQFTINDPVELQVAQAALNAAMAALGGAANAVIAMVSAEVLEVATPILEESLVLSLDCPMDSLEV